MENGIRYFDTAPMYSHGLGEKRLGVALQPYDRDSFVLGTKVGFVIEPWVAEGEDFESKYADPFVLDGHHDFSYDACMKCFEDSLERLGTDRIDIAYIHDPDKAEVLLPPEERTGVVHFDEVLRGAYKALAKLRDEGTVRAIGIGMFGADSLVEFARAADFDVFLLAGGYTLLEHDSIETLLPLLEERRVALVIGAVFKSGILATGTSVSNPHYNYRPADAEMIGRVRQIEEKCADFGVSLGAAALQFPLGSPVVVSVIPGAKSPVEVEQNLRYVSEDVPAEFWDALKEDGLVHPLVPVGAR